MDEDTDLQDLPLPAGVSSATDLKEIGQKLNLTIQDVPTATSKPKAPPKPPGPPPAWAFKNKPVETTATNSSTATTATN